LADTWKDGDCPNNLIVKGKKTRATASLQEGGEKIHGRVVFLGIWREGETPETANLGRHCNFTASGRGGGEEKVPP